MYIYIYILFLSLSQALSLERISVFERSVILYLYHKIMIISYLGKTDSSKAVDNLERYI